MATEDINRVCPTCGSRGTCSRSHKRGFNEDVLGLILPVMKPFRCRACNWRGLMGVMPIAQKRETNNSINVTLYLAAVILVISVILSIV